MKPIIYLACPYSNPSPSVRGERFYAANLAAAKLILEGMIVFSPISLTVPIQLTTHALQYGRFDWVKFDLEFLRRCSQLHVLCLDGWRESVGVTKEIAVATEMGIPVFYINTEE